MMSQHGSQHRRAADDNAGKEADSRFLGSLYAMTDMGNYKPMELSSDKSRAPPTPKRSGQSSTRRSASGGKAKKPAKNNSGSQPTMTRRTSRVPTRNYSDNLTSNSGHFSCDDGHFYGDHSQELRRVLSVQKRSSKNGDSVLVAQPTPSEQQEFTSPYFDQYPNHSQPRQHHYVDGNARSTVRFFDAPEDDIQMDDLFQEPQATYDHAPAPTGYESAVPQIDIDVEAPTAPTDLFRDETSGKSLGLDMLDKTARQTSPYHQQTPSQNPPPPDSNSSPNTAYKFKAFKKKLLQHKTLKIIQISLVVFINLMTLFGGLYKNGVVIDTDSAERTARGLILVNGVERPIVASNLFQLLCIIVARSSAFFMYPALVMVYISKLRAITSFLARTTVSMFLDCDLHELHLYCGYTILIFSISHTLAHLIRWADQGNLNLVFDHFTGLTGFLIITSCILICTPMFMYRQKIKYEIRKNLHYLFLLFGVALCFHTKPAAMPNGGFTQYVFGTVMILYVLDNAYCYFIMTEKIETTKFDVLPTGVQMTMRVSEEFQKKGANGGYCYVCLPWIDKKQWHAFSLFENPGNPTERQIFMQKGGDWTSKVHRVLQRDTVRPVWVQGPFPSPYNSAEKYDSQILVASGIGITPALSVIRAQKDSRRINLVWAVRDKHLLEFFLRHLYLDHKGWNLIFYTGKTPLDDEHMEIFSNTNICIIKGRPKLGDVIPNIIYGIESGEGLPERYVPDEKMGASELLVDMLGGGGTSYSRSDSGDGDAGGGGSDTETGVDNNVEDDFDDTASVTTQQINEVIETAKHYGFELDGINKEGLKTQPDVRCPKANRNRRSTAIAENLRLAFKPWEFNAEARPYVKSLSKKLVMKTWGLMYCGGAKVVEKDLRKIGSELKVDLHIESFGW